MLSPGSHDPGSSSGIPTGGDTARSYDDKLGELISVKDFGAKGDDSTNDTDAFKRARDSNKSFYIPPGIYKITDDIDFTYAQGLGRRIYGAGYLKSIVKQYTDNTPIFHFAGASQILGVFGIHIDNVGFEYNTLQAAANTDAIAISTSGLYECYFTNLYFYRCATCLGSNPLNDNIIWGCKFDNWFVNDIGRSIIVDVSPGFNSGRPANTLGHIYIVSANAAGPLFQTESWHETVVQQLEMNGLNNAPQIWVDASGASFSVQSMRIEGYSTPASMGADKFLFDWQNGFAVIDRFQFAVSATSVLAHTGNNLYVFRPGLYHEIGHTEFNWISSASKTGSGKVILYYQPTTGGEIRAGKIYGSLLAESGKSAYLTNNTGTTAALNIREARYNAAPEATLTDANVTWEAGPGTTASAISALTLVEASALTAARDLSLLPTSATGDTNNHNGLRLRYIKETTTANARAIKVGAATLVTAGAAQVGYADFEWRRSASWGTGGWRAIYNGLA